MLLCGMALGMNSCIGGCVSMFAKPLLRMREHAIKGNYEEARAEQVYFDFFCLFFRVFFASFPVTTLAMVVPSVKKLKY